MCFGATGIIPEEGNIYAHILAVFSSRMYDSHILGLPIPPNSPNYTIQSRSPTNPNPCIVHTLHIYTLFKLRKNPFKIQCHFFLIISQGNRGKAITKLLQLCLAEVKI